MKRKLLTAIFLLISNQCLSSEINSFGELWLYITEKDKPNRWFTIYSENRTGYFQCGNYSDVVLCEIPIWIKQINVKAQRTRPTGQQEKPYKEIKGSTNKVYLDIEQVNSAYKFLSENGLDPYFIYSQVEGEFDGIIGTQKDLHVVINFSYKNFELLSKGYLEEVFGLTEQHGYFIRTNEN